MIRRVTFALLLVVAGFTAKAYWDTARDPIIKTLAVKSDTLAPGSNPIRIAVLADIHVAGPDMPPSRVERIVAQTNALGVDLVMIAGDLASEKRTATIHYNAAETVAPLANLKAPLGTVVVPGNHDHWFDWPAIERELAKISDVTVLSNEAVQIGPIALGGVDDDFTNNADLAGTISLMKGLRGPRIILTHSPDIFPELPSDIELMIAGHTHCGQIAYPWGGSPATMSRYGDKYACGIVKRGQTKLLTSAGLGTSILPIRLFTQPEIWLIEIGPPQSDSATAPNSPSE